MLFLFMQYVMGAGCPVDIRLAQTVAVTNSSQKYYHSPLDSANNRCYITTRTKEGDKKKAKAKGFMNSLPPEFQETR